MKTSNSLILPLLIAFACFAQVPAQQPIKKTTNQGEIGYGAVRGRVFAVANDGELKIGRFVKVYLLFESKITGNKVVDSAQVTPALVFLQARVEQLEQWNKESEGVLKDAPSSAIEEVSCRHQLLADDNAILATLDATASKSTPDGIIVTEADEEGQFSFKKIHAGKYLVVARGRAGLNDVYWEQDVWVHPGVTAEAKIVKVGDSCLRSN